jgi:hypothetical protein
VNWNSLLKTIKSWKGLPGILISNGKKGKASKTAERERVCVCVCEREREAEHCREREITSAIK